MIRKLVPLAVMLMSATSSWPQQQAQQPTEWRPSIAEDNESATWEDTSAFLVTSLKTVAALKPADAKGATCKLIASYVASRLVVGIGFDEQGSSKIRDVTPNLPAEKAGLGSGDVIIAIDGLPMKDAKSIQAAMQTKKPGDQVNIVYERNNRKIKANLQPFASATIERDSFDMNLIDPLSTVVKRVQQGRSWIVFGGTNNAEIADVAFIYRPTVAPDAISITSGLLEECNPDEKACTMIKETVLKPTSEFEFDDPDMAKRYARALMHGAILCGGAKAVSKF